MEVFLNYQWPGNVRELKNVIEGAFNVIGSSEIRKENLPPYMINNYSNQKDRLKKGVYIIKQDGKAKKIIFN